MKKYIKSIIGILAVFAIAIVTAELFDAATGGGVGMAAIAAFTKACAKNVGGNTAVYLTEAANIDSVTVTAGEITALTMDSGKMFHQVQADLDSVVHTQEGTGTRNNIAYTHKVEMTFAKPSLALNTLRDSLADASPCGILAIVSDGNGTSWLVGYNETDAAKRSLYLASDGLNSGAEPAEEGGQAVTVALEGVTGYLSLPFDSTLGAAITGGSSTFITYAS